AVCPVVGSIALGPALFVKARAVFTEDTIIMVRILQKIFGLHAISGELRIARQALVFLEELGGIAALAIVLAVARLSAEIPTSTLSSAAASAATLSIIDQMPTSLRRSGCPLLASDGQSGTCLL